MNKIQMKDMNKNQMHDLALKNEVKGNYCTVQAFEILNADDIDIAHATIVRPHATYSLQDSSIDGSSESDYLAAKLQIGGYIDGSKIIKRDHDATKISNLHGEMESGNIDRKINACYYKDPLLKDSADFKIHSAESYERGPKVSPPEPIYVGPQKAREGEYQFNEYKSVYDNKDPYYTDPSSNKSGYEIREYKSVYDN